MFPEKYGYVFLHLFHFFFARKRIHTLISNVSNIHRKIIAKIPATPSYHAISYYPYIANILFPQ